MTTAPPDKPKRHRRRLRFGLRTLLVFIAVIGIILGWFAWRLGVTREQRRAIADIEAAGGSVRTQFGGPSYNFVRKNLVKDAIFGVYLRGTDISDVSVLANQRWLMIIDLTATPVTDISPLEELKKIQWLSLANTGVSDISALKGKQQLRHLDLSNTAVRDISPLKDATALGTLRLSGTNVSDISALAKLKELLVIDVSNSRVIDVSPLKGRPWRFQELDLSNTPISDITDLLEMKGFETLNVTNTQITSGDVDRLRQAFPDCKITWQKPGSQTSAEAPVPSTVD